MNRPSQLMRLLSNHYSIPLCNNITFYIVFSNTRIIRVCYVWIITLTIFIWTYPKYCSSYAHYHYFVLTTYIANKRRIKHNFLHFLKIGSRGAARTRNLRFNRPMLSTNWATLEYCTPTRIWTEILRLKTWCPNH